MPVPGVDKDALKNFFDQRRPAASLGFLNLFSGGALASVAVFALGIMPYITASIIMQLLTVVIPKLEELAKEGEQGQKEITKYTRWLTVAPGAHAVVRLRLPVPAVRARCPTSTRGAALLIVVCLIAGAVAVMWLGELITARGIGNGMSIIIFISIVSRIPVGHRQARHSMSCLHHRAS